MLHRNSRGTQIGLRLAREGSGQGSHPSRSEPGKEAGLEQLSRGPVSTVPLLEACPLPPSLPPWGSASLAPCLVLAFSGLCWGLSSVAFSIWQATLVSNVQEMS